MQEKQQCLERLMQVAKLQPDLPWWVMDMLRLLDSIVLDLYNAEAVCGHLEEAQENQQKAIDGIKHQYSEVLYKLKSGD